MTYDRLRLLQAVRLKGRAKAEDLADSARVPQAEAAVLLAEFTAAGHIEEARERLKLTPTGRSALDVMLAEERLGIDPPGLEAAYEEFDTFNDGLKGLMTRWQLKDGSTPNDHTDAAYDSAIIADLVALDGGFDSLLAQIVEIAPRLAHYRARFTAALELILAGDHSWFARPMADSYHTVWFELHEELIGLAGRTRAEEAAAGRAL